MKTSVRAWLTAVLAAAMVCCLALAAWLWPSAVAAEGGAEIAGISVAGNGSGTTANNSSVVVNLPQRQSLQGVGSLVFEVQFCDDDDALVPFAIDADGNYYEFMGTGGVTGSFRRAKTYSMLSSAAENNVGGWATVRAADLAGVQYWSIPLSAFYMRASLNNIGSGTPETAADSGAQLTDAATLVAVGVRVPENGTAAAAFVFGRAWAQGDAADTLLYTPAGLTASSVANYGYNTDPGIWWVAYIGSFGSFDGSGSCTAQGWLSDFSSLTGGLPADYAQVSVSSEMNGYFDGMNYRMTVNETGDAQVYQTIILPSYAGSLKNAVLAFPFYDRGGAGATWELRMSNAEGTEYGTSGARLYYVSPEYALLSSGASNWSIAPPAGFCGYILVDLSAASSLAGLTDEQASGLSLRLGMHGAWNDTLVDYDIGAVAAYHKSVSDSTDFTAWLSEGGETVFDFADDSSPDGLREGLSMTWISRYDAVIRRVQHAYDYKSAAEPTYGRLDGVNLRVADAADDTYLYLQARGHAAGLSEADYFSIRVADHANNAANFEFFFYDANLTFSTRSGLVQGADVYLFDAEGAGRQTISAYNAWSWITLPAGFDGYLVIPLSSIDWLIDRTQAAYAVFITNGPEGVHTGGGTAEEPASDGLSYDFGQMKALSGTLDEGGSNFAALLEGGTVYADLLASDRRSVSAQVSGSGLTAGAVSPVVGYAMEYSYMDVEGIVFEGGEQGGTAALAQPLPAGARPALYVYNEAFEPLPISVAYNDGGSLLAPAGATLVSALDDITELSPVEGVLALPANYEGWVVFPAGSGVLQLELNAGQRLGLRYVFYLQKGVSFENAGDVFADSVTVLRAVTASDAEIAAAFSLSGVTVRRAVNSYYLTDDAPTTVDDDAALAQLALPENSGNYLYAIADDMPAFKSEAMYEDTPTFSYALMPQLLKGGAKYILFGEGETVTANVMSDGTVYVFAAQDFAAEGFVKFMAINSFIDGIGGRIYGYRRTCTAGETLSVTGAYLIAADGVVSEPLSALVPATVLFGEDFPGGYKHENSAFWGLPAAENVNGRLWLAMFTGGTTEPQIENVAVLYTSEDGAGWQPYACIDHPYETAGRVLDPQIWYNDGKLWIFWAQAGDSFDGITTWGMYSENAGTADLEEVTWSDPIRLFGGLMNSKPVELSDGSYLYNANFPGNNAGVVHVYRSTDNGMTASEIGQAYSSLGAGVTFTEAKIVELENGALWMVRRAESTVWAEECFSLDGGVNWTAGALSDVLRTGSSRFVLTRLPSGNLLYVGNFGDSNRSRMTALLSEDEGKTWPYSLELDAREWVSYPDFTITENGDVLVVYDKGRTTQLEIRYAIFSENDIRAGAFASENAVKMGIIFKSSRYREISEVVGSDGWQTSFPSGTTRDEVLAQFPASVTVKDNLGAEIALPGSWTLGRVGADGNAFVTFVPADGLPWDLEDSYGLLQVSVNIAPRVVQSIAVTPPAKTEYEIGERLNVAGASVTVTYSDATQETVSIADCEITGFDSSTAGEKTITVSYGGHSASFTVTVVAEEEDPGIDPGPDPGTDPGGTPDPDPGTDDPGPVPGLDGCGGCGSSAAASALGLGAALLLAVCAALSKKQF